MLNRRRFGFSIAGLALAVNAAVARADIAPPDRSRREPPPPPPPPEPSDTQAPTDPRSPAPPSR